MKKPIWTPAIIALGLIHLAPGPAIAQDVGDRVRVLVGKSRLIGEVSHTSADGFLLALPEGTSLQIRRAEIRQLKLHTGTRDYRWWGLAGGYLLGAVFAEATKEEVTCNQVIQAGIPCGLTGAGGIALLALPTAGFILGMRMRGDKWETIPHASAEGLTLSPAIGVRAVNASPSVYMGIRVRQDDE